MRATFPLLALTIFCCFPAHAYIKLPPPPQPPVLIAEHIAATQVLSANSALVHKEDGSWATVSLTQPYAQQPWKLQWDAVADGWDPLVLDEYGPNFAASHDGKTIAFGFNVSTPSGRADDEWPLLFTAIVLCDANGSHARVAALADVVDGGPRLYFTQNDHLLLGPDYLPCAPNPDGLRQWYAGLNEPSEAMPDPPNALDLRTRQLVSFEALREVPWMTMNPYSDEFYFDEMDTSTVHFGRFVNDVPELVSTWAPPEDTGISNMYWAGPGKIMAWVDGTCQLLYPLSTTSFNPALDMNVYYAPGFFSRDRGKSIAYGIPLDEGWYEMPSLSHFAVPVDADGWAERVDTWLPLPDGSGVLINTPGIDGGGLYLVKLGQPAAW